MIWPWHKPKDISARVAALEGRVDVVERENAEINKEFKRSKENLSRVIKDLTRGRKHV